MIVVVDGLDGAGKSTFCKALAERTGAEIRHHSKPVVHPLDEYAFLYNKRLVMDRGFLGECVWPRIWKRPTEMTNAVFAFLCAELDAAGGVYVYLDVPSDVARQRVADRGGDDLLNEADREPAKALFDEGFKRLTCEKLRLTDNSKSDVDAVLGVLEATRVGSLARAAARRGAVGNLYNPDHVLGVDAASLRPRPNNPTAINFWNDVHELFRPRTFAAIAVSPNPIAGLVPGKFSMFA